MQKKINSYAYAFTDYLIQNIKDLNSINKIILYGSVAKLQADKKSDVDIFIDVNNKKIKNNILKILDEFYSSKTFLRFKTVGIDNEISLVIGKLSDWKDLYRSIMSTGIVLYGKYEGIKPSKTKHMILFYWDKINLNRGAFLNKIYGYKSKGKKTKGLLEIYNGIKTGKSSMIVPIQYKEEFIKLFKKYKVNVKSKEVFV